MLEGCTVQNNTAVGGRGGDGSVIYTGDAGSGVDNVGGTGGAGGNASGGGLCVGGGTVTISNTAITANLAQGGAGGSGYRHKPFVYSAGAGGNGFGGGLDVAGGSVSVYTTGITSNTSAGGTGVTKGQGVGGGIDVDAAAWLGLDSYTVSLVKKDRASSSDNDIGGSYVVIT
jgi:hypothetical protein